MVPEERIELSTYPLPRGCATTTLLRHPIGRFCGIPAGKGAAITEEGGKRKVSELHKSRGHKSPAEARKAKLEAALKENLRRRKAQARARKAADGPKDAEGAEKPPLS